MKSTIGVLLIAGGILLGLYVGLYLCFIGGIVDIIRQIRAPELNGGAVAWDVIRIMFAGLIGYLCGLLLVFPGVAIINRK